MSCCKEASSQDVAANTLVVNIGNNSPSRPPIHIGNTIREMEAQVSVEKENFGENAWPGPPLRHVPTLLLTAGQTPTRFAFSGQKNDCMEDVWRLLLCRYFSSCQSALVAFSKPINVSKNESNIKNGRGVFGLVMWQWKGIYVCQMCILHSYCLQLALSALYHSLHCTILYFVFCILYFVLKWKSMQRI